LTEIRIYAEGGRPGSEALLRLAFNAFFQPLLDQARAKRIRWQVIAGQSRNRTFRNFRNGLTDHPDAVNILLVDSEEQVKTVNEVIAHLQARDGWDMRDVDNEHCHLMVCMMESWIVADRDTLARHFRKKPSAISDYPNIETVPKDEINRVMAAVSQDRYDKIQDGLRLLAALDPTVVQQKAAHCRRLFDTLGQIIADAA
jgi:Glu-tRNA(Gln) amidotransferase subunit E-like FAD-binding protein